MMFVAPSYRRLQNSVLPLALLVAIRFQFIKLARSEIAAYEAAFALTLAREVELPLGNSQAIRGNDHTHRHADLSRYANC